MISPPERLTAMLRRHPATLRRLAYVRHHHRLPNLRNPRTFTEKVNWRILHDHRDILRISCDKLSMREHARTHGPRELRFPKLYWSGTDLDDLASADLPRRWVLKPNHRSGLVYLGHGEVNIEYLEHLTQGWLRSDEWERLAEWAYKHAEPKLIVEEQLSDPPPMDYKVFVFGGRAQFVQTHADRFILQRHRFYTREWEPLPCTLKHPLATPVSAPAELEQLLGTAEQLGAEFDFMRVDLYLIEGEVYFSEYTPYPGGGLRPFNPRWCDTYLGECWQLPPDLHPHQAAGGRRRFKLGARS